MTKKEVNTITNSALINKHSLNKAQVMLIL